MPYKKEKKNLENTKKVVAKFEKMMNTKEQ